MRSHQRNHLQRCGAVAVTAFPSSPCPPPSRTLPLSPSSPQHAEASLTMAPCSRRTALSLHCLGPTVSSPRRLAEVTTQTFLATFPGQKLRVCTQLPSPASQGQGRPLSPRPTQLFCLAEGSVTIGKEHELRHIWIPPRHGPSLYQQSSVCGEKKPARHAWSPASCLCTKPTWPPPFLCSTGQDSAGEAGTNAQPRALLSSHGSWWGLLWIFRGLDGLGGFET